MFYNFELFEFRPNRLVQITLFVDLQCLNNSTEQAVPPVLGPPQYAPSRASGDVADYYSIFTARRYASARSLLSTVSVCLSVSPSVRLSVTFVY